MLGITRFIGELYELGMLNLWTICDWVLRLINTVGNDTLECLCKLLTAIGQ